MMRNRPARQFRSYLEVFILALGVLLAGFVRAESDPSDERSVANGAQLYAVFCSDCHGSDTANRFDQLYAPDASDAADEEYQKLIDIVAQEESAQLIVVPQEDDPWPEWAERPDPNAEQAPDEKSEVMNTLAAVIDEAHGIKPAGARSDAAATNDALPDEPPEAAGPSGGFEPVPGATNLADPASYLYGTSEDELFESIAEGTGEAMPGFLTELGGEEAVHDVVNYIRSFWGEDWLY